MIDIGIVRVAAEELKKAAGRVRLLFWEWQDSRIIEAVTHLAPVVTPVLLAKRASSQLARLLPRNAELIEYATSKSRLEIDRDVAFCELAALLVKQGIADAAVGGAATASAHLFRSGIRFLGLKEHCSTVSTAGVVQPRRKGGLDRPLIFADVGTVLQPSVEQLVDIAVSTANTWRSLAGGDPILGFLSSSTHGSAKAPRQEEIIRAVAMLRERAPELRNLGEVQFDAAVIPQIAKGKGLTQKLGGMATILIFPDLNSANIGYKIAEHLGGASVVAVTQGFAKPFYDLSRGTSVQTIVATGILAAHEAARRTGLTA